MDLEAIASELRNASETGIAISPIREYLETNDLRSAYEIQQINHGFRIANGAWAVGKKIGLTSLKVQQQLGVDQPDYGLLFNDMLLPNNGNLPWSQTMQPKVEAEIAFVLKEDIPNSEPDLREIADAVAYAVPALEVVGSRIRDWDIGIVDTVADNASASHFVLGMDKVALSDIDLVGCQMEMFVNDLPVSKGLGKACMGSPLIATQWLAGRMALLDNPLKAGDIILTGALGPMAMVNAGDKVRATIEGLGSVGMQFGA